MKRKASTRTHKYKSEESAKKQTIEPDEFIIHNVKSDVNCFYRSISLALFADENTFLDVKGPSLKFLKVNRNDMFSEIPRNFITESIEYHSKENSWANHLMSS